MSGTQQVPIVLLYRQTSQYWAYAYYKTVKRAVPSFVLGTGTVWTNGTPSVINIGLAHIMFNGTSNMYLNETSTTAPYSFALDSEL